MLAIPLMSRGWLTAAIFSAANGLILCFRIPLEEQALRRASATPLSERPRLFPRLPLD
jgi:isoprenylcysteine carboxyl methyltransferase (ICMT) family protein YpbQ